MKIFKILLIAGTIVLTFSLEAGMIFAGLTVKVVDENNVPIKDADATIIFSSPKLREWGTDQIEKKGKTDVNGIFSASAINKDPLIGYVAKKDGYYHSADNLDLKKLDGNRWLPWNPTVTLVLKKKRNPGAMYAQRVEWIKVPVYDTPVGYDLEVGDWAAPYGKGKISDFVFTVNNRFQKWNDYESSCVLTFSNPHDGIQEFQFDPEDHSSYRWPFEAPEGGYLPELKKYSSSKPGEPIKQNLYKEGKMNYIFRVRTQVDKNGNIIAAKYGKIKDDVIIFPNGNLGFLYFFNPDGTRNLEFDTYKNYFIPDEKKRHKSGYEKYDVWDAY